MAWKVTYRGKDGNQQSRVFDAPSRDDLFHSLRETGIHPIRVEESVSIHRTEAVKTSAAFSGLQKIAVAVGSAVCVGAVICICFWAIGRGGNANNEAKNDKGSYSSTSKPSFQRSKVNADNTRDGKNTASTLVAPKTAAVLPPPPEKDWQTLQREAMARKLGRKKEHEIAYNDSNATDGNGRKPIHRNSTEHIMSMIFTTGLGEMPPPLPNVPERDKQRMAQILLDKYEIQPGDPDAEEKRTINEVKAALSEHIRQGGDIDGFFSAYHRQLELAHRERMDARSMVLDAAKSGDAELATELLEKYNQNLESKGIKPITLPQWVIEKKAIKQ